MFDTNVDKEIRAILSNVKQHAKVKAARKHTTGKYNLRKNTNVYILIIHSINRCGAVSIWILDCQLSH